jgi:hypothetical protein
MTALAPNEQLSGSPQAQHDLVGRLAALRASPDLDSHHSELSFATLSDVLRRSPPLVDPEVFSAGWAILVRRYATLGLRRLLPMERVWVGTNSSQATAFGGFHYPNRLPPPADGSHHHRVRRPDWQLDAIPTNSSPGPASVLRPRLSSFRDLPALPHVEHEHRRRDRACPVRHQFP